MTLGRKLCQHNCREAPPTGSTWNINFNAGRGKKIRYINAYIRIYLFYIHTQLPWVLETVSGSKRSFNGNDFLKIQHTTNTQGSSFLSWNSTILCGYCQRTNVWKVHHCLNLKWTQMKNSLPFQGTTVHPASLLGAVMTFRAGNFLNVPPPHTPRAFKKRQYVPFL